MTGPEEENNAGRQAKKRRPYGTPFTINRNDQGNKGDPGKCGNVFRGKYKISEDPRRDSQAEFLYEAKTSEGIQGMVVRNRSPRLGGLAMNDQGYLLTMAEKPCCPRRSFTLTASSSLE